MAAAAAGEPREPLKGLGAATYLAGRRLIDRKRPGCVLRAVAADRPEVDALELAGELADLAVADRPAVDLDHRRDLCAGAAEEELVAGVQLGAVDRSLDDLLSELVADQLDQQPAGHSLQDVVGDRWSDEDAVLVHEEVLGAALRDVPIGGQHDRLVEAVLLGLGL